MPQFARSGICGRGFKCNYTIEEEKMAKKLGLASLALTCTPKTPEPQVGDTITVMSRVTNIGTVPIPVGWRTLLNLKVSDREGLDYQYNFNPWGSPITVGGHTDAPMTGVPILEEMGGKSYDVEVVVYNEDKTVEYARGECTRLINVPSAEIIAEVSSIWVV